MKKKIDALISKTLADLLDELNKEAVPREDVVNILQDTQGQWTAIYYH